MTVIILNGDEFERRRRYELPLREPVPENSFDLIIIIGGGIVLLVTAKEVARRFPALRLAAYQSGQNSGVIHSGLYCRPGSLKAKLCVAGASAMVGFCREHGIAHDICGKVVWPPTNRELPGLEELLRRGHANGVVGMAMIGPERLRELEPHAAGIRALHVPATGITDYAVVTRKYGEIVSAASGTVLTGTEVVGIVARP